MKFLWAILMAIAFSHVAIANDDSDNANPPTITESNKQEAYELIIKLFEINGLSFQEKRDLIAIAQEMSGMKYQEVLESLIARLTHEINMIHTMEDIGDANTGIILRNAEELKGEEKPDTPEVRSSNLEVIIELLKAIGKLATEEQTDTLERLQQVFYSEAESVGTHFQANWAAEARHQFTQAIKQTHENTHKLISIGNAQELYQYAPPSPPEAETMADSSISSSQSEAVSDDLSSVGIIVVGADELEKLSNSEDFLAQDTAEGNAYENSEELDTDKIVIEPEFVVMGSSRTQGEENSDVDSEPVTETSNALVPIDNRTERERAEDSKNHISLHKSVSQFLKTLTATFQEQKNRMTKTDQAALFQSIDYLNTFLMMTLEYYTDDVLQRDTDGQPQQHYQAIGETTEDLTDILMRRDKNNIALSGPIHNGKSAQIQRLVQHISLKQYPSIPAYQKTFKDTYFVEIDLLAFAQADQPGKALRDYFRALEYIQDMYDIKIVPVVTSFKVVPDSVSFMKSIPDFLYVIENVLSESNAVQIVVSGTDEELGTAFKNYPRLKSYFEEVKVKDLDRDETAALIHQLKQMDIQTYYGVEFSDEAIQMALDLAVEVFGKDMPLLRATELLLTDIAIAANKELGERPKIDADFAEKIARKKMGSFVDPMDDPETMDRLDGLLDSLNNRVKGWEDANQAIYDAVFAHYTKKDADRTKPLSLFIVGSTGIGKSELGRALGEGLYNDADAFYVLPLGQIHDEANTSEWFGAPPKYAGHGTPTEYERFIHDHWETGGVILADEVSNMGGSNIQAKEALFKIMYAMIEDGMFKSNSYNKTFDMSKFVIIFTGNDGEKLFQGISSDDMRMEVWKSNNKRSTLVNLLRESGVPEAFLGRMADLILAKPLTVKVMKDIVRKFLDPIIKSNESRNIEIDVSEETVLQFTETFFSQDEGARSLRNIIEDRVSSYIGQAYLEARRKGLTDQKLTVSIELRDNFDSSLIYIEDPRWKRKVELDVILTTENGERIVESREITSFAPKKPIQTKENAQITSDHEAGHSVVKKPEITGTEVGHVTNRGGRLKGGLEYHGYVRSQAVSEDVSSVKDTRDVYLWTIAGFLAGQRAQMLAGNEASGGWSNDIEKARSIAYNYFVESGAFAENAGEDFVGIPFVDGKPMLAGGVSEKLMQGINDLLKEADQLAIDTLLDRWTLHQLVSRRLMEVGTVSHDEFKELEKIAEQDDTKWVIGANGKIVPETSEANSWWNRMTAGLFGDDRSFALDVKVKVLPGLIIKGEEDVVQTLIDHRMNNIDDSLKDPKDEESKGAKMSSLESQSCHSTLDR